MKNKKQTNNIWKVAAIGTVGVLAIMAILYVWVIPRYSLSIDGVNNVVSTSKDGVKYISAVLDIDCDLKSGAEEASCAEQTIVGKVGGNRKVSVEADDNVKLGRDDSKITATGSRVTFKNVAIRREPIKSPVVNKYKLTVVDDSSKKQLIIYELTVNTILNDNDLSKPNAAPTAESIVSAVQKVNTVSSACITNEDNDPNGKLGKPGTYFIKVTFRDSRSTADNLMYDESLGSQREAKDTCEVGNDAGGSVEVFRTQDDAKRRGEELQSMAGGFFDSGTSKVINTSVIRTSSEMKASEQKDLEAQLVTALTE